MTSRAVSLARAGAARFPPGGASRGYGTAGTASSRPGDLPPSRVIPVFIAASASWARGTGESEKIARRLPRSTPAGFEATVRYVKLGTDNDGGASLGFRPTPPDSRAWPTRLPCR